jgi:hypothetical protein
MKRFALILVITINAVCVMAQSAEKKTALSAAKSNKVLAVAPTKMAVLYMGIDNPVDIAISDMSIKYITATVDSGEIENKGDGKFIVRINKNVKVTKINVFETYNGYTTKIGERSFKVKRVPDPVPSIASVTSGAVSKSDLIAAAGLIPVMKDFEFDEAYFVISSYTMTMNVTGDLIEKNATGNKLTTDMINIIQKAPKGTKIYFENIKVVGPDGKTRTLSSIIIKLI